VSAAADLAPLAAAGALGAAGSAVALLHSAQPGPYGRRSLLAIDPDATIVTAPGAGSGLPAIPPRLVHEAHGSGLWVGAIAYDAGLALLGIPSRHEPVVPAFVAGYHATYAAFDHERGDVVVHGPAGPARDRLERACADALAGRSAARPGAGVRPRPARSSATRAEHVAGCAEVQRLIALGEAFEVNLAHVIETPWPHGGLALLERLVDRSPGDHAAYLRLGGVELASISPELFLRVEGDRVETRPIKGTRPRGATPRDDEAAAAELSSSVKDRAENVMIVDLLRNDLTATAVLGSVEVAELCTLERTASVMHLVSSVTSRLAPGVRQPDVLVSCFPGGSVTGAPKRRAMELIDRLERAPRGFYCGSVFGYEPAERRLVASIAIRTATVQDGVARYGTGGAVTLLSDPDEEADETLAKAAPFLRAANARLAGW
jgi:para-aminobenzoate synthetase component I